MTYIFVCYSDETIILSANGTSVRERERVLLFYYPSGWLTTKVLLFVNPVLPLPLFLCVTAMKSSSCQPAALLPELLAMWTKAPLGFNPSPHKSPRAQQLPQRSSSRTLTARKTKGGGWQWTLGWPISWLRWSLMLQVLMGNCMFVITFALSSLGLFQRQRSGDFWKIGFRACRPFQWLKLLVELNWTELKCFASVDDLVCLSHSYDEVGWEVFFLLTLKRPNVKEIVNEVEVFCWKVKKKQKADGKIEFKFGV